MQEVSGSIPLGSTISPKTKDIKSIPSDHFAPVQSPAHVIVCKLFSLPLRVFNRIGKRKRKGKLIGNTQFSQLSGAHNFLLNM